MSERDRDEKREMRRFMCVSVSTLRFMWSVESGCSMKEGKKIGPETFNKFIFLLVFQQMVSEKICLTFSLSGVKLNICFLLYLSIIKKFFILEILSLKFGTRLNTVYSKTLICNKQNKHSN